MVTALVDTSALFALLDEDDLHHAAALQAWDVAADAELLTHGYIVAESVALVRSRLGRPAVDALIDRVLPALRVEMVEREVHDAALADCRALGGGTSFVDRVTITYARRHGIALAFAFDADLHSAGLAPLE